MARKAVIVTGTSSGIGRATAIRLHRSGFAVYATARRAESITDLAELGIATQSLDVTDEASMVAVVQRVLAEHGAIAALVNNAGYELAGTVEETPIDDVRAQFDTNVFGLIRLTQLVLPHMREAEYGRIVNVSSIFGRLAVPGKAFYDATKFAVTGFTESLRLEVAGFGIGVSAVEPGATRTRLKDNAVVTSPGGPYAEFHRKVAAWSEATYGTPPTNLAGRMACDPDDVARAIEKAIRSPRPAARYPVGVIAHVLFGLRRVLPAARFEAVVRQRFPVP